MKLAIFYSNGAINRIQEIKEDMDIQSAVSSYNADHEKEGLVVRVEKFPDDSLVTFIFRMKERKDFKQQLYKIAVSMNRLEDELNWLKDELRCMED